MTMTTFTNTFGRALLACGIVLVLLSPSLSAQGVEGRIMGRIVDRESGEPLPGTQVQLEGGQRAVMAGVDGRFQFDRVPGGVVTLRVSMIGYAPQLVSEVQVDAGTTARVDISLVRAAIELAGLEVSAQQERGSSVALISEQRTSSGVVNAISAEQIARSPDGDAAAAMQRVSGVTVQEGRYVFVRGLGERYTTSSLNGARIPSPEPERKVVPLDLFPSGLLQSITTSKTFTPDQPGDFSGGSVNIRTPSFPTRRTFSFSASTGYNPDATGQTILRGPSESGDAFAFGTSARSLPSAAATYPGTASRGPQVNSVVNSFRNVWSVGEAPGKAPLSMSASVGGSSDLFDRTLGYLGSFTYSNSQDVKLDQRRARVGAGDTERDRYDGESGTTSVLWGGLLNLSALFGNHTQLHLNNSYNRSSDNEARREVGLDENTRASVQIDRLTYVERSVRSSQLMAEHQFGTRHRLDWALTTSAVSRSEPDRSEFVRWLDPEVPVWFNDFEGAVRTFGELDETSTEGSLKYALSVGSNPGNPTRFTVGVNWRENERDARSQGFRIQSFDWGPNDPRWQAEPEEFFDGRHAKDSDSIFILSRELAGGSYDASDQLFAGFAMAELNLTDRLRLVGGARLEAYTIRVNAESNLANPIVVDQEYTDVLPSVAANFALTEQQQLRVSASRTLSRPEYRELAPITYREVLGGDQVIGNPELDRALIDNLDVRWEWYPTPGEVISLGFFAKNFDAPIEQRYLARSGTDTKTFQNAESATNRGIEIEVVTGLGRVSPSLMPLSLFSNVTVMESEVNVGPDDAPRAMVGQAPYVVNTGLTYANPRTDMSATLLFNVVGERIVNARASGSMVDDVIERPRQLLDFSLRFPLRGGASAKVDLKNILDSPFEVVQGPVVRDSYRSGRSLSLGVSWRW